MIERILEHWDSEENELCLRWRLFKSKWFPYRTARLLGFDEETLEMKFGPLEWRRPDVLNRRGRVGGGETDG